MASDKILNLYKAQKYKVASIFLENSVKLFV